MRQSFQFPENECIDLSILNGENLVYEPNKRYFPLVIQIQPIRCDSLIEESSNIISRIDSQITMASFVLCSDHIYTIKIVKQIVRVILLFIFKIFFLLTIL